jgi:putative endonuclease
MDSPPTETDPRRSTGRGGERAAAEHFRRSGWCLIARNARTRHGEIDLIGLDREALVFVEVKALRGSDAAAAARALEAIGPRKRLQVRRLARAWLAEHGRAQRYREIRFDAVGVALGPSGRACAIAHVPAAF